MVLGGVQGAAGDVVDEQVVDGDVECFGDADDGVQGWCDLAGLVAADALRVGADLAAEGSGPDSCTFRTTPVTSISTILRRASS